MTGSRAILHVDMDAFFASVEQRDHPDLQNRPVLVGHDGPRGVVAAASYEARRFGCHSAQPIAVAKRLCPQASIVPGRMKRYVEASRQVIAIFESITDLVQPLSIDEAFLDVTGSQRLFGTPVKIAELIKQRIRSDTQLTGSVGVAPNKFLAKLASDLDKPDGLVVIEPQRIDEVLLPLPVTRIWGIGPAAADRLANIGVHTIADLRALSAQRMKKHFGSAADHFHRLARGIDDRQVTGDRQAKSIGEENTFGHDVTDRDHVRRVLLRHTESVARRLRRHQLCAGRVTVKIRYGDFETITRSATLDQPTDVTRTLWRQAATLFDRWAEGSFRPVRLIGMTAGQLAAGGGQMALFTDPEQQKQKQIDTVVDQITDRFGKSGIHRGTRD